MKILQVLSSRQTSLGGPLRVAEYISKHMQLSGEEVRIFPEHDEITQGRWFIPSMAAIKRLYACILWADVVHIHGIWTFPADFAAWAARLNGKPYFINPHGMLDIWQLKRSKLVKTIYSILIEKKNLKKATAVCFTHQEEMQEAIDYADFKNAFILPNAVDTSVFDRLPERAVLEKQYPQTADKIVIFFMARLHPKKGLDLLLGALSRLSSIKRDSIHLLVAGEKNGAYYNEMVLLVGKLSLDRQVTFVGEVLGEQKATLLGGADIFALTSHQEGDSIALKEAMASGLPLLMTKQCHYSGWGDAGFAKVVDTDIAQIASAIDFLISDTTRLGEMGAIASQYAKDHFHTGVVYGCLREAYRDAIDATRNSIGWVIKGVQK